MPRSAMRWPTAAEDAAEPLVGGVVRPQRWQPRLLAAAAAASAVLLLVLGSTSLAARAGLPSLAGGHHHDRHHERHHDGHHTGHGHDDEEEKVAPVKPTREEKAPALKPAHHSPPPAPPAPPRLPSCHFSAGAHGTNPGRTRTLKFVNQCPGDLMVNMQGFTWHEPAQFLKHRLPGDGGFHLGSGQSKSHAVSERLFSGRIWARPNCTSPCNPLSCGPNGTMWCDTGNCPGANETTCRGAKGEFIGGLPPGPLLELTLCGGRGANPPCYADGPAYDPAVCEGLPVQDFYDLSNVDGTSKIWASLAPKGGRKVTGPGAPADQYNCGAPAMPGPFNLSDCPKPLRIARNDSDAFGFSPNATTEFAIGCLSACNFMALVGSKYVADRTRGGHRNLSAPAVSMVTPDDIAAVCCECGHGGDNGICPTPFPNGTWPPPNDACVAGCSPFGAYPPSYASTQCSRAKMPAIRIGKAHNASEPKAIIELGAVPDLFKAYAPEAYSWQFDDAASTFVCTEADYTITFCPS